MASNIKCLFLAYKSDGSCCAQNLFLLYNPALRISPSHSLMIKKERKQHINHMELLKLLFEYDKVTPFVLQFTTACLKTTIDLSGCRHLYIQETGTKGHGEHLEWQIILQRKEKNKKTKKMCRIYYCLQNNQLLCPFFKYPPMP